MFLKLTNLTLYGYKLYVRISFLPDSPFIIYGLILFLSSILLEMMIVSEWTLLRMRGSEWLRYVSKSVCDEAWMCIWMYSFSAYVRKSMYVDGRVYVSLWYIIYVYVSVCLYISVWMLGFVLMWECVSVRVCLLVFLLMYESEFMFMHECMWGCVYAHVREWMYMS